MKLMEWLKQNKWITVSFACVIILWILYLFFMLFFIKKSEFFEIEHAGTFGDMFGALNTLFTGLAFGGVVFSLIQQNRAIEQQNKALDQQQEALKIQKNELDMYKMELKKNIEHLEEQNKYVAEQNKNANIQRFETTLFNLIHSHSNIISNIRSQIGYKFANSEMNYSYNVKDYSTVSENLKIIELLIRHNQTYKFANWNLLSIIEGIDNFVQAFELHIFILQFIEDSRIVTKSEKQLYKKIFINQFSKDLNKLYFMYVESQPAKDDYQHNLGLMCSYKFPNESE